MLYEKIKDAENVKVVHEKKKFFKEEIFEVVRGQVFDETQYVHKMWEDLHRSDRKDCDLINNLKKIRDNKRNYGGAFYSVNFRVDDGPIYLHELGFFGPHKDEEANYFAFVEIFKPKGHETMTACKNERKIGKNKVNLRAKHGDIFYVNFGAPILIEPKIWYLVQFMLNGPDTLRCDKIVKKTIVETPDRDFVFEFDEGSKQLPVIRFSIPPPTYNFDCEVDDEIIEKSDLIKNKSFFRRELKWSWPWSSR